MASKMSKKFSGLLSRSKSARVQPSGGGSSELDYSQAPLDSPEVNIGQNVKLFCESGNMTEEGGDEMHLLHLPVIVEAAESSPSAAAAAASQIRKFLGKDWAVKPHAQYNAVMLIRILSDNPGPSFTRNFDKAFVSTVKEALRNCRDASTQQLLRETLDSLEANKQYQEGMEGLVVMWRKEKGNSASLGSRTTGVRQGDRNQTQSSRPQGDRQRSSSRQLPPPMELASRIEEARNTAKILLQFIQSTPAEELLSNEIIKEFAERCQSAQRSMQTYISAQNPPPDDDTMLTLIETNEQLSLASTRYQRSVLTARRQLGISPSPNAEALQDDNAGIAPPPGPPPQQRDHAFASNSPSQRSPDASAFAAAPQGYQPRAPAPSNRNDGYDPPPGPPPAMLARLNSREGQSPTLNQSPRMPSPPERPSDPFADPEPHVHNPASSAVGDLYERSPVLAEAPANERAPGNYNGSPEAAYAPSHDQAFGRLQPAPVPQRSPQRPGPAAWHNSDITPSYMGRQASAANGLVMHGAGQPDAHVPEIDGYSEVGRTEAHDTNDISRRNTLESQADGTSSAYSVSPVTTRDGWNR